MIKDIFKQAITLSVCVIILFLPYFLLLREVEDIYREKLLLPILAEGYFYSLFLEIIIWQSLEIPILFLLIYFILGKTKKIQKFFIIFYHLFFSVFTLALFIHQDYFQRLPHLNFWNYSNELTNLPLSLYISLIGIKEVIVLILFLFSFFFYYFQTPSYFFSFKTNIQLPLVSLLTVFIFGLHFNGPFAKRVEKYFNSNLIPDITSSVRIQGILFGYSYYYKNRENIETIASIPLSNPYNIKNNLPNLKFVSNFKKNPNIIIVQMEALAGFLIDLKINGKEITPFLNQLKKNNFYFKNFYSQSSGGGSSDAEMSSLLSLLPLRDNMSWSKKLTNTRSLVKILNQLGYSTVAMHSNSGDFYNRSSGYPRIGFQQFLNSDNYVYKEWGEDKVFFQQSIDYLKKIPKPFFAYLITIQGHDPYTYSPETKKKINFENTNLLEVEKDYLLVSYEVDQAFKKKFDSLEKNGLLENTIVIVYSDHKPYHQFSDEMKNKIKNHKAIPLFIYANNISPKTYECPGSHLDIAPTITHLLGIKPKKEWLGDSLFNEDCSNKKAVFNNYKIIYLEEGKIKSKQDALVRDLYRYSIQTIIR